METLLNTTQENKQSDTSAVSNFTSNVDSSINLKYQEVGSKERNTVALKIVIMDKPDKLAG